MNREEIGFCLFCLLTIAIVFHFAWQVPERPRSLVERPRVVRSDAPYSDDQSPLGPLDVPGAASWSGDEPGKDGKEK